MLIGLKYGMTTDKLMPKFAKYLNAATIGPWIDTGVYAKDTIMSLLKFILYGNTGDSIYGTLGLSDPTDYRFFNYQGRYTYFDCYSARTYMSGGISENIVYELEIGNNYVKNLLTGSYILNGSVLGAFTTSKTIKWIAKDGSSPVTGSVGAGLYYLKIFDGDQLIRDYRATTDKSGVACLYDIVNGTYTYNSGSGEFTAVYE